MKFVKSYWKDAILEDGTELQIGRDGLLYKITYEQARTILADYPKRGDFWYFNDPIVYGRSTSTMPHNTLSRRVAGTWRLLMFCVGVGVVFARGTCFLNAHFIYMFSFFSVLFFAPFRIQRTPITHLLRCTWHKSLQILRRTNVYPVWPTTTRTIGIKKPPSGLRHKIACGPSTLPTNAFVPRPNNLAIIVAPVKTISIVDPITIHLATHVLPTPRSCCWTAITFLN